MHRPSAKAFSIGQCPSTFSHISLFWRFQLAGWAVFVAVTFPLKIMLAGSLTDALILCAVRDGSSFFLTLGLRRIYGAFWSNDVGRMVAVIVVSCSVAGLLQNGFFFLLHSFVSSEGEFRFAHSKAFDVLYERTGLLFGWSFLYFGIRHAVEGVQRDLRLALIESEKRQAQLQMLRSQVNPHFLFNALNSIQVNVESVNADLGRMVQSLSDFLRFSLDHSHNDFIPLGREYDAMRSYLQVEKIRFRNKLEFHCEIDEQTRAVLVPGIILQPLVENAVKYGRDTSEPPLRITVQVARRDVAMLKISVSNSGEWLEPAPREKESHLGLQSLRDRLGLIYPEKYSLNIASQDGWVTITILIPVL
ncbi:MAG: hypothetical protein BGO12_19945 [Verrucomicrobia bacterium 61-8]|nr:histidine kinase [Verrucomicrobiota bacterium]OJU98657.1 MAG: hypothetical protein BGO12_19945 [Verrucomicrobia bacterium 61-8]